MGGGGVRVGVGTSVDPTLTRADRLVGQVLGEVGQLPEVYAELEVNFFLLRRLLGVRTQVRKRTYGPAHTRCSLHCTPVHSLRPGG